MLGEAGIVKDGKKGKILDRGITMMFVGYSENHAEMVFRMYHPETSRIAQSRDVIWLGRMYHTKKDAELTQQLPIVTTQSASMTSLMTQRSKSSKLPRFLSLKKGG